jgi:glycosyltransferase involved in cell wall biosynthesis
VVGAGAAAEKDRFKGLELVDWSEEREIAEVQQMDIGVMPLPDEPWARGKCGYKLIQYMACGLPVVASPVGVNGEIVSEGASGYLAADLVQWEQALSRLAGDPGLRRAMGETGRRKIVADYSLAAHAPRLAGALKALKRA